MDHKIQLNLSDLEDVDVVFWTTGNNPTQKLSGLALSEILLHLKALYLLSDKVLAAASFYFESPITREATDRLRRLFERGEVLYFVDADIEDYAEHGVRKIEKSPINLSQYQDKGVVLERARQLDSLGRILRRPAHTISDRIVELWIEDLASKELSTLGWYLIQFFPDQTRRALIEVNLEQIARTRGIQDFVWEYLEPKLLELHLPKEFMYIARRRLAQMYAAATSQLLGVPVEQAALGLLSPYISKRSQYDSELFLSCMDILGALDSLRIIGDHDLVVLKYSPEFMWFKLFYFSLIEAVEYSPGETLAWLVRYRDAALRYSRSAVTKKEFLQTFKALCAIAGKSRREFSRPLDVLLSTYDSLHRLAIDDFVAKLRSLGGGLMETGKLLPEQDSPDVSRSVFVIHGRDDRLRKDLFSFLRAIGLHPKEWTQLVAATSEGSPYIGHVVDTAFSTARAILAFMTPDDEAKLQDRLWRRSGEEKYDMELTPQPRPNVLFEAGMAFGKAPDRTILVTISRLRPISDIEGRHAIRLDNSPEKRRELAQRLQTAGCIVNLSGEDWLKTGNFSLSTKKRRTITT